MASPEAIDKLRGIVEDALARRLIESAVFYADKIVSMTKGKIASDVLLLARAYFEGRHFRRALHVLQTHNTTADNLACRYVAAQCYTVLGEWEECLDLLGEDEDGSEEEAITKQNNPTHTDDMSALAGICYLRGQAFEELENRGRAAFWYRRALAHDVHCHDAYVRLTSRYMLSAAQKRELYESLRFSDDGSDGWLATLYAAQLDTLPPETTLEAEMANLEDNAGLEGNLALDVCRAERLYATHQFHQCRKTTKRILDEDPFHQQCLPIHVACLVELGEANELFYLAHRLVDEHPDQAIPWFAVGCFYYVSGDQTQARRFFVKATNVDESFGPAWIGFGHSFAREGEHDQAMAAYRSASRLFRGCHLPLLFIGMEYIATAQLVFAEQFIYQARSLNSNDPAVYNELGAVYCLKGNYRKALHYFHRSLELASANRDAGAGAGAMSVTSEATTFNMGSCFRKLRDYTNAIKYYERALALAPSNASTYTALGFSYHLIGDLDIAISYYHKALGLKPEDTLASEMLSKALQETFSEASVARTGLLEKRPTALHNAAVWAD